MIIAAVERRCAEDDPVRVFVGFNAWTNLFKKQVTAFVRTLAGKDDARPGSAVKGIRRGRARMLLESDWNPADFDFRGSHRQDVDKVLVNGVIRLAEILEETPEEVAALLARNTEDFMDGWVRETAEQEASSGLDPDETNSEDAKDDDGNDDDDNDNDDKTEELGKSAVEALRPVVSRQDVETLEPSELKASLRQRGLSTRGSADEQRQRLLDHDHPLSMVADFKDVLRELDQRL